MLVSAPADGADVTLAYGVNTDAYDADLHTIVSNASCTTNALAPSPRSSTTWLKTSTAS